jgi:hypothetical protein
MDVHMTMEELFKAQLFMQSMRVLYSESYHASSSQLE